jgi:large subunit ribosomal protein L21
MSYAIIKCGSKQFRVQKGLVIDVEKIIAEPGEQVIIEDVLHFATEEKQFIGQPFVAGARVVCELLKHKRADKVVIMKLRRRKNSRRRAGHRQHLSVLRIVDIILEGVSSDGN